MVLNGTMDLDAARTYSSVARTVAQAMSTEVSRSRFLQSEPSLDLPSDVFEDDDSGPSRRGHFEWCAEPNGHDGRCLSVKRP